MVGGADIAPKEPKRAAISGNTDGFTVVAAVTGKAIRVVGYLIGNTGAALTLCNFQSNTTDLCGDFEVSAHANLPGHWNPDGHVQTAKGEPLKMGNSATQALGGYVVYYEV